jgi:hypothetical protein
MERYLTFRLILVRDADNHYTPVVEVPALKKPVELNLFCHENHFRVVSVFNRHDHQFVMVERV